MLARISEVFLAVVAVLFVVWSFRLLCAGLAPLILPGAILAVLVITFHIGWRRWFR